MVIIANRAVIDHCWKCEFYGRCGFTCLISDKRVTIPKCIMGYEIEKERNNHGKNNL